ncbi:MAG: hypothetical protein AAF226_04450 [Verrucomicrobiota bacterium]
MHMEPNKDELLNRYLAGIATDAEIDALDGLLSEDAALRQRLLFEAGNEVVLRELAMEIPATEKKVRPTARWAIWMPVAAGVVLFGAALAMMGQNRQPQTLAVLVESENATWQASVPTVPGSQLGPGFMKLKLESLSMPPEYTDEAYLKSYLIRQ